MFSYQRKMPVNELAVGMYVFQLDRAWHGTPFPLQGFHIKDESDIRRLGNYCKEVTIDVARSDIRARARFSESNRQTNAITRGKFHHTLELKPYVYPVRTALNDEIKKARSVYKDLEKSLEQLADNLSDNGELQLDATIKACAKLVKSIIHNPDAMIWVMKLKHAANTLYHHSLNCAVWGAVLGREIGLKESRLQHLVTGILLSKIGLTMLREEMAGIPFWKFQLTPEYFRHVDYAVNLLANDPRLPTAVTDTIFNHEERYDCSGFPNELEGDQIPLFAQIAGIVDTYESMLNPHFSPAPVAPNEAISKLYNMRGHEFDSKLVESFIQVLGLFPPGTLIELNTNELAIVTGGERDRRMQPQILVVTDANKQRKKKPSQLDIHSLNQSLQEGKAVGSHIEIKRSYPLGSFDIWPHEFRYQQDSLLEKLLG
jgi:HD-GYP domain-containing protein (c-di-GMP phosphodiesterase class II)